jgi:hypothetical protein
VRPFLFDLPVFVAVHDPCLRNLYIRSPSFKPSFTPISIKFPRSHSVHGELQMDVVYVGGLVLFAALTFGLVAGCGKLTQYIRGGRP